MPALLALTLAAAGCGNESSVPSTLADGSPARISDIRFEGVHDPVVRTTMSRTSLQAARAIPRIAACLRSGWSGRPLSPVVSRVGVSGDSVTFPGESGHALQACDGAGSDSASGPWCGHAFGRLAGGRLRDPRLDLACRTTAGDPIAFAWVEPGPGARYLVVARSGFSESYETGNGLPVRVAVTERTDPARSRAVIDVSEHTASGRLLRRRELEAVVSG